VAQRVPRLVRRPAAGRCRLVLHRPVPRLDRFTLACLPEDPVIDWTGEIDAWLDPLAAYLKAQGAFAIRLGPPVHTHLECRAGQGGYRRPGHQAAHRHARRVDRPGRRPRDRPPYDAVFGLAVVAEFAHLAEDRDAAPALDRRQRVQGGADRVGVGVAGVVDQCSTEDMWPPGRATVEAAPST